ncbi:hypothetical protein BCA_5265 [Bacillus cereus 03BB102]|uniref:Uncharacterized protein n=1 Tax=Bacillus cereus (strain 03BB102) TaxID=572264 RepID=A0A158RMX8_BACC3|nr:hypothetical protein BCA_5265 [Bacillus cereus 03BB102]
MISIEVVASIITARVGDFIRKRKEEGGVKILREEKKIKLGDRSHHVNVEKRALNIALQLSK